MNDFTELEAELKKLRPRAASPGLTTRVERALADAPANLAAGSSQIATAGVLTKRRSFRVNWLGLGLGLAAAAMFLLMARVNTEKSDKKPTLASFSPVPFVASLPPANTFVRSNLTQVVYSRRDEGLQFPEGADQPLRRVRAQKRETLQWNNPGTQTSLRISYPTEEVTLIPVSGQ